MCEKKRRKENLEKNVEKQREFRKRNGRTKNQIEVEEEKKLERAEYKRRQIRERTIKR